MSLASLLTFAQADLPPGSIKLLPGYQHKRGHGIDSTVGVIWKTGGLLMEYDIGAMAGDYTHCPPCGWSRSEEIWRKKRVINGQRAVCVLTKKKTTKTLFVSFPELDANFFAVVRTDSDSADMFQMLSTFQPIDLPR